MVWASGFGVQEAQLLKLDEYDHLCMSAPVPLSEQSFVVNVYFDCDGGKCVSPEALKLPCEGVSLFVGLC